MSTRRCMAALAALLGSAAGSHALAQDFSKVVIGTQQVAEGVYMLTGAGGNIGVSVGQDGIVIIDDQYKPLAPKIVEALAKLSPKPARFVINTHWHGDHTGGNEAFGEAGAVIVAHDNIRKRLTEKQVSEFFKRETPPAPRAAWPVVTFATDMSIHYNDEELRIFHVPNAHTDGDGIIEFRKANVIHMGDTFFNGLYPFIDAESGGSTAGMIAAADKVLAIARPDTKIIPGHGPLATRAELEQFRAMLVTLLDNVGKLVREGKTLEEIIAAKPTASLDEVWGKGFFKPDQVVAMVYRDLKRTMK